MNRFILLIICNLFFIITVFADEPIPLDLNKNVNNNFKSSMHNSNDIYSYLYTDKSVISDNLIYKNNKLYISIDNILIKYFKNYKNNKLPYYTYRDYSNNNKDNNTEFIIKSNNNAILEKNLYIPITKNNIFISNDLQHKYTYYIDYDFFTKQIEPYLKSIILENEIYLKEK